MRSRSLKRDDIPILKQWAEASGFPYPELSDPLIESVEIVVDSEDRPIAGVAAKRLIELYGWFDPQARPEVKLEALKLLHRAMAENLRAKGYNEANAFIPPQLAEKFGRRLQRTFGWVRSFACFGTRF